MPNLTIDDVSRKSTRGGAVAARRAHNPKVVGSSPTPATKTTPLKSMVYHIGLP